MAQHAAYDQSKGIPAKAFFINRVMTGAYPGTEGMQILLHGTHHADHL
jgi:hypothetical protein